MTPIKLALYIPTSPVVELYSKCYDYGSSSWDTTVIIILVIIVVLTVLTSIYCFYWRKDAKVKPQPKKV